MKQINFLLVLGFLAGTFALSSCKGDDKKAKGSDIAVTGEPFALTFTPSAGDSWNQTFEMNADIKTEVMGQKMDMPISMSMDWNQVCEAPEGENAVMSMKINRMTMKMDNPMMAIDYDSENEQVSDDPIQTTMNQAFGAFIGESLTMVYGKDGSITETRGMQEILAKSGMTADQMSQMGGSFSESMKSYLPLYPKDKIRIGESWTNEIKAASNGSPFIAKNTYTVADRKDGKVFLNLESELSADAEALKNSDNPQLAMMEDIEISGTQDGTLTIDEKSGMVIAGDFTQDMDIKAKAMGMDIPTTLKSKVILKSN